MAEEMENAETGSKNKVPYRTPEEQLLHNKKVREWKHKNFARAREAVANGEDLYFTKTNKDIDNCITAAEIKAWGLSTLEEVRPAKKGEPGYYADKIL